MTSVKQEDHEWDLPSLKEVIQSPGHSDLYSVKFYPYTKPGVDPVFAVVGGKSVLICRPPVSENSSVEFLQVVVNEGFDGEEDHFACAWSKDIETGTPWLCVAGKAGKIQVINALTGQLLQTLIGHGGEIEDLVISPLNPHILASACEDASIRLWNLDPARSEKPCVGILQGEGHRSEVLSISFHITGNYLLSSGIDRSINLWTIPPAITDPPPFDTTATNNPLIIHYPHFSTSEISHEIIDCVAFHGDLVLCKSANSDAITLFSITGFDSSRPLPSPEYAPTTYDTTKTTRSAFVKIPVISSDSTIKPPPQPPQLFTRLMSFHYPDSEVMFTRFSLSPPSSGTSVLAFCNQSSKVFFWDLDRLCKYYDWSLSSPWELNPKDPQSGDENTQEPDQENPKPRPRFLSPFQRRARGRPAGLLGRVQRQRSTSPTNSTASHDSLPSTSNNTPIPTTAAAGSSRPHAKDHDPVTGKNKIDWDKTKEIWQSKYEIRDAFKGIEAHKEEMVKGVLFTGRQVAWSADAMWCIVVGSGGVIAVLQRRAAIHG